MGTNVHFHYLLFLAWIAFTYFPSSPPMAANQLCHYSDSHSATQVQLLHPPWTTSLIELRRTTGRQPLFQSSAAPHDSCWADCTAWQISQNTRFCSLSLSFSSKLLLKNQSLYLVLSDIIGVEAWSFPLSFPALTLGSEKVSWLRLKSCWKELLFADIPTASQHLSKR